MRQRDSMNIKVFEPIKFNLIHTYPTCYLQQSFVINTRMRKIRKRFTGSKLFSFISTQQIIFHSVCWHESTFLAYRRRRCYSFIHKIDDVDNS